MDIDALECESNGYKEGRNPMFGEWSQTFDIKPVTNGNRKKKNEFYQLVRQSLTNRFVYTHQVAVEITLFHDEQDRLETTLLGDLDNYAKTICDAISGSEGVLIDDCQIHSLTVSWIDRHAKSPEFEISIKAGPDDFQPTPVNLYEMPDGLYYPLSDECWTREGTKPSSEGIKETTLLTWRNLTQGIIEIREKCQNAGIDRVTAFQNTMGLKPQQWGFHRNRARDSGFSIITMDEWLNRIEQWLPTCTNDGMRKLVSNLLP